MPSNKKRSSSFRRQYLEYVQSGHTVDEACKHFGIHRSTYYKWQAIAEKQIQGDSLLKDQKVGAPAKKTNKYTHQILAAVIAHPSYSLDRLSLYIKNKYKCTKISRRLIQVILEKHHLSEKKERKNFSRSRLAGQNDVLLTPAQIRKSVLAETKDIKVSQKCKLLKIGRSTYYKWRTIYKEENRLERKASGAHTVVDERIKKSIIDLIIAYPEWSVNKLYSFLTEKNNGQQLVSRHYIQYLLQKEKLSTLKKRLSFSLVHSPQIETQKQALPLQTENYIPASKRVVLARGDPPPPRVNYNLTSLKTVYSLAPQQLFALIKENPLPTVFTAVVSILNAYLTSQVVKAIAGAGSISEGIGMGLSSLSLFCGIFFFLYSVKYYITTAGVLIKSQGEGGKSKEGWLGKGVIGRVRETVKSIPYVGAKVSGVVGRIEEGVGGRGEGKGLDPVSLHKEVQGTELKRYPYFSVQIPLYNEKKVANRVTAAAAGMDYPNYEVIVCDDSTDETTGLLYEKWEGNEKVKILHRTNRAGFKGAALGNALEYMDPRTEYIVVFDADFVPYPDTLTLFAKYFQVIEEKECRGGKGSAKEWPSANEIVKGIQGEREGGVSGYKGKTVAIQGYQWHVLNKSENWITRAVRSEFAGSYIIERSGGQVFGLLKQIAGSVYAINAKVLKEVGWGTSITEDFQLTLKLYERGYKVAYTPYIQAPSECVSTLKRLIRQRQRWAEGHSFNIKKHILGMIRSPDMTTKEKWEAIYLTPYYLQAFVFIVGTFSWIIAETVLRVRLPFWTSTLGWSLVLTNLFSLPLMNTVGLFMEEGEERDYLGIFSFITLCYLLAPFIGFAALKGFLEKEEGPWFRTPKSGHITDKINRADKLRSQKITKYLPWIKPALDILRSALPERQSQPSPYLAYVTAGNSFSNIPAAQRRSVLKKRLMHTGIVLTLGLTVLANIAQSTVPQAFANPDTYYAKTNGADNLTNTGNDRRLEGSTSIGSSVTTQTISSTNPTMYIITDNMNKIWTNDTKINDSNTTGERRNVAIATHTNGDTTAVWEDSRNTDSTQNKFVLTQGSLNVSRYKHTSTLLADGKILVAGGLGAATLSSAEIYDPFAQSFSLIASGMTSTRQQHRAVLLNDGRVLLIGGLSGGSAVSSTEIFDPNTNTFSAAANMSGARAEFSVNQLNNGKILVAGGCNSTCTLSSHSLSTAEIYEPQLNSWSSVGNMSVSRTYQPSINLDNGEILVSSGTNAALSSLISTSEIYNPITNTWRASGSGFRTSVGDTSRLARLPDGKILSVFGDYGQENEIYDPVSGTWARGQNNLNYLSSGYTSNITALSSGKVLVTHNGAISAAEIYDPYTASWSIIPNGLKNDRMSATSLLLTSGQVIVIGGATLGGSAHSTSEIYTPVTYDIYAQKYDKSGSKLWGGGSDIKVNSDDGNRSAPTGPANYNHLNPTVGLDSTGNAIVGWEEQRDGVYTSSVWAQKLQSSDGSKLWPSGTQNSFSVAPGSITNKRGGTSVGGSKGSVGALLSNGKVYIAGSGVSGAGLTMAEVYDPVGGTFTLTGASNYSHQSSIIAPLLNGRILVAGDSSGVSPVGSTGAEEYDPVTNTHILKSNMTYIRTSSSAITLKNGKVLITGTSNANVGQSASEIYDPATGTFSTAANMTRLRSQHAMALLPNGKVLVVGGAAGFGGQTAAELYDPASNTFSAIAGAHASRSKNSLVLLNNGKVLSVGAGDTTSTAELYDPVTNSWTSGGVMLSSRRDITAKVLPNGKVLVAGGYDNVNSVDLSSSEIYDPATNTWVSGPNLKIARDYALPIYLPGSNKVLILKGDSTAAANTTAELYTPISDMPVSQYEYRNEDIFPKAALFASGGLYSKRPKITIDSNGDAILAWSENRDNKIQFQGLSHNYDSTAYTQFGKTLSAEGKNQSQQGSIGATPAILSPSISVVAQKLCARASGCESGTTQAERQWVNDIANENKNNPQNLSVSSVRNSQNVSIISDSTNTIAAYDSDSGTSTDTSTTPKLDTKNKKIFVQKLNSSGTPLWNSGWAENSTYLTTRRYSSSATVLNDGRIVIIGGNTGAGSVSTAEILDPKTGSITQSTNNLAVGTYTHVSTLLGNGKILVTGVNSSTAELYTPSSSGGSFALTTGNQINIRSRHAASLLNNGKVLIAGGENQIAAVLSTSELYDPITDTFSSVGPFTSGGRRKQIQVALGNGKILSAGGQTGSGSLTNSELYDPVSNTWSSIPGMNFKRSAHTLTLLPDGRVLAVGGSDELVEGASYSTAEIYNPLTNTWSQTGSLTLGMRDSHTAILLPNNKVLISGGEDIANSIYYSSTEIYDPTTGTFTAGSSMVNAKFNASAALSASGQVAIIGGATPLTAIGMSSIELYNFDQPLSTITRTQTTNVPATSSYKTAGTSSGTNWTTASNTASSDNSYAIYNNTAQDYLKLTNFGLTSSDVPTGATITGVTASIEGNAARGTGAATSAGPRSVGSEGTDCTNQTGTGTVAWSTPGNCGSSNDVRATASVDGTTTNWERALNFGFSIPTTATINGIVLGLERSASAQNNGGVVDAGVRLVKGGTIQTTDKSTATVWSTAELYEDHGTSSDLWGTTWSPSDINASNFGAAISAKKVSSAGNAITARIDHIRITVYYTTVDGNNYHICLTKDGSTCTGTEKTNQTLNTTTDTTTTKGSSSDLWGATLSQSDVTSSNFGIMIRDGNTDASALNFDQVQLKVDYTTAVASQATTMLSNNISQNPDLVKDSDGNIQVVWQSWRGEGITPRSSNSAWKIVGQKINNPSSGAITKAWPSDTTNAWSTAAAMSVNRMNAPVVKNLANGKVFVTGGKNYASSIYYSSTEIYDPQANTWSTAATSITNTYGARGIQLRDGRILVAGSSAGHSMSEIYDPLSNTWTLTGKLNYPRTDASELIMLSDGQVLMAGGVNALTSAMLSSTEIYNPSTGTWTNTGSLVTALGDASLIKSKTGKVIMLGGCTNGSGLCQAGSSSVQIYDPLTATWSLGPNGLISTRAFAFINVVNDNVFLAGGVNVAETPVSTAELFNLTTLTTRATTPAPAAMVTWSQGNSVVLPNGKILVPLSDGSKTTYIFDPGTETWSTGANFSENKSGTILTTLKNSKPFAVGGPSTAEIYTPDPSEQFVSTEDFPLAYNQTNPKIAADSASGKTYVAWADTRLTSPSDTTSDTNIYMQRINSTGYPTWPNGSGTSGTYNVRDVRINNTRGALDTSLQGIPAMAKSIFDDGGAAAPIQLAWLDTRGTSPPLNIYGQSYDTKDRSMTSTNWTAYYYVTGSPSGSNSISVQVGAAESDGETMSYTSAASTYTGNGTNGEKNTLFSNLPPSGETNLTHRRLVMKLTWVSGSMQIQYNGSAGVADTRLDVGLVVPERSILLGLLIPALPGLIFTRRKYKSHKLRYTVQAGRGKK